MKRLDVVCWKWTQPGYRSTFTGEHVNVLRNMIERNYPHPHRFSCITDDPTGIDSDIRIIPLWDDFGNIPNPSFARGPSCYRRLKAFSAEARRFIGPRFVSLDLDVVIVDDMAPIWDREEDFIIWGDTVPGYWYNGSMWMMTAGARRQVWDTFDPVTSPRIANRSGRRGSDQGWISYCLGRHEATWSTRDGVYSFRIHLENKRRDLPPGARIVIFHGHSDPWDRQVRARYPWVLNHWR